MEWYKQRFEAAWTPCRRAGSSSQDSQSVRYILDLNLICYSVHLQATGILHTHLYIKWNIFILKRCNLC